MSLLVVLLILLLSLGTLFFLVGYGALFFGAFSRNSRVSVALLILLGFSGVGFVAAGLPWYYALPCWLMPPIYAQLFLPAGKIKKRATMAFWGGLVLFAVGLGILAYTAQQNADIQATIQKIRDAKNEQPSSPSAPPSNTPNNPTVN